MYKAKTGVGCDGFHPKIPLDLTKETRGEILEFCSTVESGRNKSRKMEKKNGGDDSAKGGDDD